MRILNAENTVLGRLASYTAQELLRGENIAIVNAEKAIITGKPETTVQKYRQRFDRSSATNPKKGPKFPRTPDRVVKRSIRGMLPNRTDRGKECLRKLKVYIGLPEEMQGKEESVENVQCSSDTKQITINDLCTQLGWTDHRTR